MFPISDENERGHGPAYVSLLFIALNILVFIGLQAGGGEGGLDFTYGYSTVPYDITRDTDLVEPQPITVDGERFAVPQEPGPSPIWLTLFSSMFMHGGWLHLAGNMLFLWVFGDNVEHRIGHLNYALFYVAAGIVGSLAHILTGPDSFIPSLGASGAISGVLGAYIVMFPMNRVTVAIFFRFFLPVPALVAIGLWAVLQFVNGLGSFAISEQTGGVAYMAHIGGFVAGVAAGMLFRGIYSEPRHPRGTPARLFR